MILSKYYTVESAAKATGLKYKTLLKRINRGKVKVEEVGRMKFIPAEEVERIKSEQARYKKSGN